MAATNTSNNNPPTPSALNAIPMLVNPQTGDLIKRGRVKTVGDAIKLFQTDWNADLAQSAERTRVQQMLDGMPPYSVAQDKLNGYAGRTNVNWGLSAQSHNEAVMPYNTVLESIDTFATIPTNFGTEQERLVWQPIIEDEMTRMLRKWPRFFQLWMQNANLFVAEGLSFAFFEDDMDWRWDIKGQQYFKFPRRVRADLDELDRISCKVLMPPDALYRFVRNPEIAAEEGWNPEATIQAIKDTAQQHSLPSNDWQEWEKAWKENDMNFSNTAITVEVIQMWVKEVDGTVSHYIFRSDGKGEFLYKKLGKYRSMRRLIIDFKYGVGTNGDFGSIRGHGQMTFNQNSAINRILCKACDMAVHQATPHLMAPNEDGIVDLPMRPMGPYIYVESGVTFPEVKMPDFDNSLGPVLNQLQQILFARQQSWTSASPGALDRTERTKYEKQMQFEQSGKLSTAGMTLFFVAWEQLFKEVVRRVINPEYTAAHPGGAEVWQFITRCVSQGVPLEAIRGIDIDGIEINMGVGKGSATERRVALDALRGMYYNMDAKAKNILNQQTAASFVGIRAAKLYFPDQPGNRPPLDLTIAELESNQLALGQPVEVLPNQNHVIHLGQHLQRLAGLNQQIMEGGAIEEIIPQMQPLWEHAGVHLQYLDPNSPETAQFRKALQELSEVVMNGARQLQKMQREQQEGMQQQGEEAAGSLLVQSAQVEASQKFMQQEADFQQKLRHKDQEHAQKLALMQAQGAAKNLK